MVPAMHAIHPKGTNVKNKNLYLSEFIAIDRPVVATQRSLNRVIHTLHPQLRGGDRQKLHVDTQHAALPHKNTHTPYNDPHLPDYIIIRYYTIATLLPFFSLFHPFD